MCSCTNLSKIKCTNLSQDIIYIQNYGIVLVEHTQINSCIFELKNSKCPYSETGPRPNNTHKKKKTKKQCRIIEHIQGTLVGSQ